MLPWTQRVLPLAIPFAVVTAVTVLSAAPDTILERGQDPVVISGALLPEIQGRSVDDILVAAYDATQDRMEPIPFQVDERFNHLLNPGGSPLVYELMYDVLHEDDGLFDDNDEIALLYSDAGDQDAGSAWIPVADTARYEIRIADPRPGGSYPDRFVYVFTGFGLARSPVSYMSWPATAVSTVDGTLVDVDSTGNWLLTGLHVAPSCGSGTDILDRMKGRAGTGITSAESEESWDLYSTYLGGIVGPVRAIRYVQGAASGVYTTRHDVFYPGLWEQFVNLRVHQLPSIWYYFDLLPQADATFFSSENPEGVPIDGVNDPGISQNVPTWTLVKGSDGGFASTWQIDPSPFVQSMLFYYRDDASFDDQPNLATTYTDDDDSAYGDHGIQLQGVTSTSTDTIPLALRSYALCSGQGDATLGAAVRELVDYPLQLSALRQDQTAEAIRTLSVARSGADIALSWQDVPGATSYRVYSSTSPDLARDSWTLAGVVPTAGFVDSGAAGDGVPRFYSVTAVTAGGEGPW